MFYRNTGITEKTGITLSKVIKTMSDISIVMTLSTLPTKRCGLYSLTTQRTLGTDASGHLCYWFYDGNNDRCLNGSTVLSGTDVKVGVVHSRKGVRLYVNGVLDAFCEAPLWSENVNTSYIGTHGLAPSDLEMDGTIEGVLLTDYAMTDEEMSVASWDSELCVVKNHLFYVPSNSTLHVGDDIASSLDEGSVYVLEDTGSLVLSNEEKLPCWYIGEYNATTQDITLNISDKRGGGTYNRMEVDHLTVHEIEVANTGHVVEAEGEEDVYPYLAVDEYNNAIFTNPHIDTMKVEYHCSATAVSEPTSITVWGSSYDDTFPYIYAKYTITYKDGASGTIISVVRDPSHQQYMVRTVTCYVESNSSTFTWPTDPTQFASGTTLSFYGRNAHAGKYQFTRQWTWFGINWYASSHSDRPNASVVTGFTSGHWVSGSETAIFVVDDDYLRNIVVVEDVASQSLKDYASSHSQPVSSYMGKKMLPKDLSGGYALSNNNGSIQAKDIYLEQINADGFNTSKTTANDISNMQWGWNLIYIDNASDLQLLKYSIENLGYNSKLVCEGQMMLGTGGDYITSSRQTWPMFETLPTLEFNGLDTFYFRNWGTNGKVIGHSDLYNTLVKLQSMSVPSELTGFNSIAEKYNMHGRLYMVFKDTSSKQWIVHNLGCPFEPEVTIETVNGKKGIKYGSGGCTVTTPDGNTLSGMNLTFIHSSEASDPARIHIISSIPINGVTELLVSTTLTYPSTIEINYTDGTSKYSYLGIKSYGGTYRDEQGIQRVKFNDWFIQGRVDVRLYLDLSTSSIRCYEYITRHIPTSLSVNPTYEDLTGLTYTNMSDLDLQLQTWNVGGIIEARNVVPISRSDEYVSKYGAMLGGSSNTWDSVFTKGISSGKQQIARPYNYGAGCTAMFLFDNYVMIWGKFVGTTKIAYFPVTMTDTNYVLMTDVPNIEEKSTIHIRISGSDANNHWWLVVGTYK